MGRLFWLSDAQWSAVEPHLPKNQPGARQVDDRRVISGIIQVLRTGCRWRDCPAEYGPHTTIYNRFHRWSRRRGDEERGHGLQLREGPTLRLWRKRGARARANGPSRGGQTTKIHALTDVIGRPFALTLTPGNVSDVKAAPGTSLPTRDTTPKPCDARCDRPRPFPSSRDAATASGPSPTTRSDIATAT